jgi:hypothetical protein
MSARLDTREWEVAVNKLAAETRKDTQKVMEQSAKLLVRDIVRNTPPFGNAPNTESFGVKKKIGEAALIRDVQRIYGDLREIGLVKSNTPGGKRVLKLAATDQEACKVLLNKMGYPTKAVLQDFDKNYHKKSINKRGKVHWRKSWGKVYVLKRGAIKKYITSVKKRVGTAMSGWSKGVAKLKVTGVGKWAKDKRAKTRSHALIKKDANGWSMTLSNRVGFIQHIGTSIRPVQKAIKSQTRNLNKRIEQAVAHAARKAKMK